MDHQYSNLNRPTKGHDQIARGTSIVTELNALDGVWPGRIQVPGQEKTCGDRFSIHQTTFIRSLRPILDMPIMAEAKPAQIALLLNAYWGGIAKILPEPFSSANNSKNYVIQRSQGVLIMHCVLPRLIEILPSQGKPLTDPIAYADVMHDLPTLSGEIVTSHGVTLVSGAAFWLSGPAGVVSQFGGDEGRKRLAARVRALIPRPLEGLEI